MRIQPFKLDQWLNKYHFSPNPPSFDLASSYGPPWTLKDLLNLVSADERESLLDTQLTYANGLGGEQLRQAIADMQGVKAEDVQILVGASEALLILFACAAEPGANVILPSPIFPSTAIDPELFKLEVRYYHLRRENNFDIDIGEIKRLVDNKTRVLLVNTPHNPTGATLSNEQLRELHDFAVDKGIQFVSDEVYHPIYFATETETAAVLPHATVLGSFSKSFALSGIRTGWIVERDRERMQQYAEARSYFTISNPPLAEKFAEIAVRNRETIFARTRDVAAANLRFLEEFFSKHEDKLGWVPPRGGLTIFPWLNDDSDSRVFCAEAAERGVLLAPGDCFEMPNHFRLGFGVSAEGFGQALARISELLEGRSRAVSV
jgi:aspartate/methionine/tyrosine aminotransferase